MRLIAPLLVMSALWSAPATSASIPGPAADLIDELATSYERNEVIPFLLANQHPAMRAGLAAHLNLDTQTYDRQVRAGYSYSLKRFRVAESAVQLNGRLEGDGWILLPLSTRLQTVGIGRDPAPQCGYWLFFRDQDRWYVENLSNPVTRQVLASALPGLSEVPINSKPRC